MMTNTMRNTKIRRTLAAIMSSIIIVSAGMTVSATTVNAASMDAVVSSTSSASGWKTKLSDSDTALETSIRSVKTYIDILSKKLPCGDYFKVFTSLLDTFDEEFSEKTSLKEVLDKLEEVQKKIEQAKTTLIDAMESVSDMAEFTRLYNTVAEQTETLTAMLRNIQTMENTHAQKSMMKKCIGTTSEWLSTSNIVFNLVSFGKYLAGEKKLTSNDKTIYDTMMSHYSKKVLFGKEAIEKTDKFIYSALAVFLDSTEKILHCIHAEKEFFMEEADIKPDEELFIEAINCNDKAMQICHLIINSNTMFDRYKATYSPYTLYDRSDPTAPQKDIRLMRDLICQEHTKYLDTGDLKEISKRSISEEAVKYIVSYVKNNYPGRSVSDFLRNVIGFNLNTPDESKTWITVGNLKTESFNTNISVVNHYYYDGVRVTNTSLSQETINYAYHSITLCFDTHKQMTEGYVLFFAVA